MPERIKIVIHPNPSGADVLTIEDAMNQVLDWFALVELESNSDEDIRWNLVSASTNSPFFVEGEASNSKGGNVDDVARFAKANLDHNIEELIAGRIPPKWEGGPGNSIAKRIFKRNTNGIGKTEIYLNGGEPKSFTPKTAKKAEWLLSRPIEVEQIDRSRTEIGSIEAVILEVGTFYNKPAIKIIERLTKSELWCVIPEEICEQVATSTNFKDVWENRRVLVRGVITYDANGVITRIYAKGVVPIEATGVKLSDIIDKDFTDGRSPEDYLDSFREGELN